MTPPNQPDPTNEPNRTPRPAPRDVASQSVPNSVPPLPTESPARPQTPTRIGRFLIRQVLGEGAFARVYLGFDPMLGREAAIKVFKLQSYGPEVHRRLERECRAAAQVSHRNVCPVYEVEYEGDALYVVMYYVPGGTLADLIQRGPIPLQQAVRIAGQIASGLAAAHARGIMHGDLKPGNVLYDGARREVLITDFGITRSIALATAIDRLTRDGGISGTPAYMSPEQCKGELTGPAADIYSLGVILFRLLTGRLPFSADSPIALLIAHIYEPPVAPSAANPAVDRALDAICLRALAKKPEDRFASAQEFANALRQYLHEVRPPEPSSDLADLYGDVFGSSAPLLSGRATGAPPSPPPTRPRVLPTPPEPDPTRRPSTDVPRPITDAVHFSVTAPAAMRAGSAYVLSVWAHLAAQRDEVLARARQAHPLEPVQMQSKGPVRVARGTTLTVQLRVPTFAQPESAGRDAIEWDGDIGTATFPVTVPPGAAAGGHPGTATIHINGFEVARLDFTLQVAPTAAPAGLLDARQVRHRRAFASYATRDRDAVLARIQGLQKALPDLDIFLDVASLRAGDKWAERLKQEIESRDVFYLFWSKNARKSEWVEREWRLALAARGIGYIDPVPLADPRAVPPPPELAAELHFNDWVLAYMSGAGAAAPGRGAVAVVALVVLLVLFAVLGVVVFVLGGGSGK